MDITEIQARLKDLDTAAAALVADPVHAKSEHIVPLRARISAAADSAEQHAKWLAVAPPAPAAMSDAQLNALYLTNPAVNALANELQPQPWSGPASFEAIRAAAEKLGSK